MTTPVDPLPSVLTIAGSDGTGGAGLQADLATFAACGVRGLSAVTVVVAQNDREVGAMQEVDPVCLRDQVRLVCQPRPPAAVKIGLLSGRAQVEAVVASLAPLRAAVGFVVCDPVAASSSGHDFLDGETLAALRDHLLPLCDLVTPNLHEAARLAAGRWEPGTSAEALATLLPCPLLLKGGHAGGREAVDLLVAGGRAEAYALPRIPGAVIRGSGCRLSSAIAAHRARGAPLGEAVSLAKAHVHRLLTAAAPGAPAAAGCIDKDDDSRSGAG